MAWVEESIKGQIESATQVEIVLGEAAKCKFRNPSPVIDQVKP